MPTAGWHCLIDRSERSCSNPAYMGTEQVREVSHEGGLLVLRPPLRPSFGRPPEQRVLYWEKVSEVDG